MGRGIGGKELDEGTAEKKGTIKRRGEGELIKKGKRKGNWSSAMSCSGLHFYLFMRLHSQLHQERESCEQGRRKGRGER